MSVTPDTLRRTYTPLEGPCLLKKHVSPHSWPSSPAHDGADEQVDWDALRGAWRVGFPSDYRAFMTTYGAGGIDDAFSVLTPEAATQPAFGQELGSMAGETATMRHLWATEGGPDGTTMRP